MRKQRVHKDYWDKYKDYSLDSSLHELDCDKLSLDWLSFDNKREDLIEDGRKKEDIRKDLEDNEQKILLDDNKRILKPV